jgi:hypothetical protein
VSPRKAKLAPLEEALGRKPHKDLAALPPDVIEDLAAMVHAARANQAQELRDSLDRSMRIVPRPLRPALKKVLL